MTGVLTTFMLFSGLFFTGVQLAGWRRRRRERVLEPRAAHRSALEAEAARLRRLWLVRWAEFAERPHDGGEVALLGEVDPGLPAAFDRRTRALRQAFDRHHAGRTLPALAPRAVGTGLAVEIGTGGDGAPVVLSLDEAALGGDGPHGLLVGATGSGKSELLRTVVTRLLARPADRVRLVLVDFKGGATFAPFAAAPQVAALVTNLAEEAWLADRMRVSLVAEIERRQRRLREAQATHADEVGEPRLVVVVDEFAELLAAHPDLIDLLHVVGRVGRALGLHLLLASQRLEEGRLKGLEAHLSYRIALRTFTAMESRVAVGTDAAFRLPREPGHGLLLRAGGDGEGPTRFHAERAPRWQPAPQRPGQEPPVLWLPPLTAPPVVAPEHVGLIDRPREQRHVPLAVPDGVVAIAGGRGSGATSLARRVAQARLAATGHEPVVVDGWGRFVHEDPLAADRLAHRWGDGRTDVVVTVRRWSELGRLRDAVTCHLELRLGDPADSRHGFALARGLPRRPGVGLTEDGEVFHAALPLIASPLP